MYCFNSDDIPFEFSIKTLDFYTDFYSLEILVNTLPWKLSEKLYKKTRAGTCVCIE